jgi:pilus assembly protein CpaB
MAEAAPRGQYLVAARPVRAGTLLRAEDLAAVETDVAMAPAGARRDSREARTEAVGSMARRSLAAGDMILEGEVLRPGERGFLAAVLSPGMRAFSVSVDAVTGAAGLIWPGDRVDLLLTQQLNDETVLPHRRVFGETVVTDVRVIAIDQAIVQGAVGDGVDAGRNTRTVTLELNSRQSEAAAVATRLGRLSLLLRAALEPAATDTGAEARISGMGRVQVGENGGSHGMPATPGAADAPVPVFGGDVSPGLRQGRVDSAPPRTVQIFLGGARREEFRF